MKIETSHSFFCKMRELAVVITVYKNGMIQCSDSERYKIDPCLSLCF